MTVFLIILAVLMLAVGILASLIGFGVVFHPLTDRLLAQSPQLQGPTKGFGVLFIGASVLMAFMAFAAVHESTRREEPPSPSESVTEATTGRAQDLVKQLLEKVTLPMTVDEATRLDAIKAVRADVVRYDMTITQPVESKEARGRVIKIMRKQIMESACDNPNFQSILKEKVSVEIVYSFADGERQTGIVVTPKDCPDN